MIQRGKKFDYPSMSATKNRRVVYTCMFGYSEKFSDFSYQDDETDFVCFTDNSELISEHWNIIYFKNVYTDPVRAAKRLKHLPTEHLIGYEQSLYIDNTIRLDAEINFIFRFLATSSSPLMLFRHPWRDCIYQERSALIAGKYDNADVIQRQLALYRRLGHPSHAGLFASGMLLRHHGDEWLDRVMLEWHLQVVRHSYRDQLSLPFILREMEFPVSFFPGQLDENTLMTWPVVRDGFRLPRDFDDQLYLDLHADVRLSGVSPRRHYFYHGYSEGRRYR